MKTRFKFTNANLKAIPPNSSSSRSTELEFSDTEISGLKLLSGKSGSKRFLLRYTFEGRKRLISIGRFPDIDLSTARKVARKHKSKLAEGIDPKAERDEAKAIPTVGEFFHQTYLPLAKQRKKTWHVDQQRFQDCCGAITHIRYDQLKAADIQQLQLSLTQRRSRNGFFKPSTCNRTIAVLKTMGALAENLLEIPNVAARISLLKENNERTRFCSVEETKAKANKTPSAPRKIGRRLEVKVLYPVRASDPPEPRVMGRTS